MRDGDPTPTHRLGHVWPLFDLRVTTPRIELRMIDDELGAALAELAAGGIHDPASMPFAFPWTDVAPPQLQRNTMQFYWRCRADISPHAFNLNFAVCLDGEPIGSTGLAANDFATLRTFETGSWLGRAHHGLGLGRELREATLHLGFAGFGALVATTAAFHDNEPSLGVTRSLGYLPNGEDRKLRRNGADRTLRFQLPRERWEATLRRDDICVHGLTPALAQLGLDAPGAEAGSDAIER